MPDRCKHHARARMVTFEGTEHDVCLDCGLEVVGDRPVEA